METKGFFQFEIIISVLVSSFWFICLPMLWVYNHYKYFHSYSVGIDYPRQLLTTNVGPGTVRVKSKNIYHDRRIYICIQMNRKS